MGREVIFLPWFNGANGSDGRKHKDSSEEEMQERRMKHKRRKMIECGQIKIVPKYGRSQSWWKAWVAVDFGDTRWNDVVSGEVCCAWHGRHAEKGQDRLPNPDDM